MEDPAEGHKLCIDGRIIPQYVGSALYQLRSLLAPH